MDEDKKEITRRIRDLTLEIISLLSGEGYTIEKETWGDCVTPIIHHHESGSGNESPITEAPHSWMPEKKILELTNEIINEITELLTGEVPVRCQDAAVYFSMEEWEYMEGQKDQYQDVRMKCDPPRIDQDKGNITARILILARQIIDVLKEKEHTEVTRTSGDRVTPHLSGGWSKIQSPNTEALHSPTPEKEVLQLTKKITELLTGEVSLRCQDIALYFSMEQWDYVEGHWDQYKDLVMEEPRPLVSPENTSDQNDPERIQNGGHVTLSAEYYVKDEDNLSQSTRDNLLILYREHLTKYKRSERRTKRCSCSECEKCFADKYLIQYQRNYAGEKPYSCSECGKCFANKYLLIRHERTHKEEKEFSCSECGRYFMKKAYLVLHEKSHKIERPYSCSKCDQSFSQKSNLVNHEKVHILSKSNLMSHLEMEIEEMYSCSECGKCFNTEALLSFHQKDHTGEKPCTCSDCGMCFLYESSLLIHEKIHAHSVENDSLNKFQVKNQRKYTVEKPYSCSECGKCFISKDKLHSHQGSHTQGGSYFTV